MTNILGRNESAPIKAPGVSNGNLVFPEDVVMNTRNIGWISGLRRLASKFQNLCIFLGKLKGF
jgi:hypothetical protein